MPSMIADLYGRLSMVTTPWTTALGEASDESEAFTEAQKTQAEAVKAANEDSAGSFGLVGKAVAGISVGFALVSAISMKWATSFQSQMELLNTQAGVPQAQIASLGNGVEALAGQVGFSPTSLAGALFHVESSFASVGITGTQALSMLKTAAEGAAVGHADLTDETNALDAAVVSGIPGVQNLNQAMGILNATVGAGDMTMSDLVNSFSTGLLASVKGYGLSITDVGAALAVFGDNNIRGQNAATELRMAVQALAVPAATGAGELKKMGLSTTSLAVAMQNGGLLPALEMLKQHMDAANISTVQQGQVLTDVFGKKAGVGINILYDQLDRLQGKYPVLAAGANNFASDWVQTQDTVKQQLNQIGAAIQAAGIKLGTFLLPLVSKFLGMVTSKGTTIFGALGTDMSQLASGFSGTARQGPTGTPMGNSRLNDMAKITPPPLTMWQKFGQVVHTLLTDLVTFGQDTAKAFGELVQAAKPAEAVFGTAFVAALLAVGSVLKNILGPALVSVAGFLEKHGPEVKLFAEVVLGALIVKLTILSTIKAATGIVGLANSIIGFPVSGVSKIGEAFGGLQKAWSGLGGTVSKLWGGVNTAGAGIGKTFAFLGKGIGQAGQLIGQTFALAGKGIGALAGTLRSGAVTALGGLKSGLSGMGSIISQQVTYARGMFAKIMPTKLDFQLMLQSIKDAGSQTASTIAGWGKGIAGAVGKAGQSLADFGGNVAKVGAQFAKTAWTGMISTIRNIGSAIGTAAAASAKWVISSAAATLSAARQAIAFIAAKVAMIGSAVAEGAMTVATWLLDTALDANPISILIIAIAALIAAFVLLWIKCSWFRDFWKGLWHDIQTAITAVWNFLWSDILQPIGNFFSVVFVGALHGLETVWSNVWGGIKSVVSSVWGYLKPIFSAISSGVSGISGAVHSVGSFVGGVGKALGFDQGGFVPGAQGAPMIATVHGGEYVLSNDMLAGRAPIDQRALTGALTVGPGGGGAGGSTSALAVRPGGSGGTTINVLNVNVAVAGNVRADKDLTDTVRTQVLQYFGRNGTAGWAPGT